VIYTQAAWVARQALSGRNGATAVPDSAGSGTERAFTTLVQNQQAFGNQAQDSAETNAPGAVPPTGGVSPEDSASAAGSQTHERSATDDLADGIDLLRRAARKALRSVDPRIEAAAERALSHLQELDEKTVEPLRQKFGPLDPKRLETLVTDVGREFQAALERVTERVESAFGNRR